MVIKGFFFDLDGTLVDTHEANFEAYRRTLAEHGVEFSRADFLRTIGHQAKVFLPWFLPGLQEDDFSRIAQSKARHYKSCLDRTKLNEPLVGFLREMRTDHKTVLVTTASSVNTASILDYHQLTDDFDHVITANDVSHSKPDPQGYIKALNLTRLVADEVIAFEDSAVGINAAETAGIRVVRICRFLPA